MLSFSCVSSKKKKQQTSYKQPDTTRGGKPRAPWRCHLPEPFPSPCLSAPLLGVTFRGAGQDLEVGSPNLPSAPGGPLHVVPSLLVTRAVTWAQGKPTGGCCPPVQGEGSGGELSSISEVLQKYRQQGFNLLGTPGEQKPSLGLLQQSQLLQPGTTSPSTRSFSRRGTQALPSLLLSYPVTPSRQQRL